MNLTDCSVAFNIHKKNIKSKVIEDYPNESVIGITSDKEFIPFYNIHSDPNNFFRINPEEFYKHDIAVLIHSHTVIDGIGLNSPDGSWIDPRTPSKEDMELQKALNIPFAIVSTDGDECSNPLFFPDYDSPLLGIEYINGVYDCWSLLMRFYHQKFKIKIDDYPRAHSHWDKRTEHADIDVYTQYEDYGFIEVEEPEYGDLIIFKIKDSISHGGIYVGDDKFIHHISKRLSCTESLPRWRSKVWKIARHKDKL